MFGLYDLKDEFVTVYPRGLDLGANYEITMDNSGAKTIVSAFELVNCGIKVNLDTSLSSELIIYKKV